jgi:glucose/arabinose dehydrogenase
MYVWEKGGTVWIVEHGVRLPQPLINISDEVGNWADFGLVSFALDPNFRSNGYIYLYYVVDRHHLRNHGTADYDPLADDYLSATVGRITRYQAVAPGFTSVDYGSRTVLFGETASTGGPIIHTSHGVGTLVFGQDGTLLASMGDGASFFTVDEGSAPETYWQQGLDDGVITSAENVGAYRSQMLDSHSGKILRLDPATGDGVPSNPFYDPANPRSARSRTWALGVRNAYRFNRIPHTGSHFPSAGDPGVLILGDVGWGMLFGRDIECV